jgi:hypothetical protein
MVGHAARQASVDQEFAELVCADPALLRAEFDAIVAANFGRPERRLRPPLPPRRPRGRPEPEPGTGHVATPAPAGETRAGGPVVARHVRQRSPPPRLTRL